DELEFLCCAAVNEYADDKECGEYSDHRGAKPGRSVTSPFVHQHVKSSAWLSWLLLRHRQPDVHATVSGRGIEGIAVPLESRSFSRLVAGFRQPAIPDREPRPANRRHMLRVCEDRIQMRRNTEPAPGCRQIGEVRDLHAADVLDVALIVTVTQHAIRR